VCAARGKEACFKDSNSEYSLESGDGKRSSSYCMTADGSTALFHSDSAVVSPLSRHQGGVTPIDSIVIATTTRSKL